MNIYGDKDVARLLYLGGLTNSQRLSLIPTRAGAYVYDTEDELTYLWNGTQWVAQNLYGSKYQLFESSGFMSDTQGAGLYTQVFNVTTSSLPVGRYHLKVSYSWNHNGTTNDFISRLQFDGANVGSRIDGIIHQQEPKDSNGSLETTGTDQTHVFEKTYYPTVTTAGSKNIVFEFGTGISTQRSSIWDVTIELFRVQ